MPTQEHQPQDQPLPEGTLMVDPPEEDGSPADRLEQRYKTVAVRVEEQLHSQLQFIAHLGGTSISEEIRAAIQTRIEAAQNDPALIERAQQVRQEIEREAAVRTAAIAGFMGQQAAATALGKPRGTSRSRNTTNNNEQVQE